MLAIRHKLTTPGDIAVWVRDVATLHGAVIERLSYPDDCDEIVRQFANAGVAISAVEGQAFWYAYCFSMQTGWMTPFKDCVGVLDELAAEIEAGDCLDDSRADARQEFDLFGYRVTGIDSIEPA